MVDIFNPLYQSDIELTFPYLKKLIENNRKKILIIGATGLIGSFLVDSCILFNEKNEDKFEIYAMGRSKERLEKRFKKGADKYLHLIEHNINNKLEMSDDYDIIFHLASNADPRSYEKYPYETITTNVQGTINVINYVIEHPNTEVLFTSTMEVYGEIQRTALSEEMYGAINFNDLRSGYPESKRVSELLYRSAIKEYGINAKIGRLGYIYGPTMTDTDNKIIAEFIRKKADGEPMRLKSAGTQKRTYCYVGDAVTGMLTIVLSGENGQVCNIADDNSLVSLRELAQIFGAKISSTITDNIKVYDTALDTQKLQALGWKAITHLKDGVDRTIKCIR